MSRIFAGATPLWTAGTTSAPRALIVLQEAFGVNEHIRDVAERFSTHGYYVVAPELFHRSGSPDIPYDDFPLAMEHLALLTKDGITEDLLAAAAHLTEQGYAPASTAVVGYCMGGTVAFYAGTLGGAAAIATYYGSGIEVGRFGLPAQRDLVPTLGSAVVGFFGDLDTGIPVEQVEGLRTALEHAGIASTIYRYADGLHGFHCDGRPDKFNADYAADAYEKTLAFFEQHVVAR